MAFNISHVTLSTAFMLSSAPPSIMGETLDPMIITNKIEKMKYYTYTPIVSLLVILGLFGNSCIITVCMIQKTLSTGYTFIGFLALSDLISCFAMIPWPLVHLLAIAHHWPFVMTYNWNFFLIRITLIVVNTFMKFSALLTCALSLDRYVALHYPHRYVGMSKKKSYTRIIIGACFFISLALMIPRIKKFTLTPVNCSSFYPDSPMHHKVVKAATMDINHPLLHSNTGSSTGVRPPFHIPPSKFQSKDSSISPPWGNCFTFLINKEYHSSRFYWYYKWWREIILTLIPLILLLILNINIIYKYKRDIMRKKLSMTLPPNATEIMGTDNYTEIDNGYRKLFKRRSSRFPTTQDPKPAQGRVKRRKTLAQTSFSTNNGRVLMERHFSSASSHKRKSLLGRDTELTKSASPLHSNSFTKLLDKNKKMPKPTLAPKFPQRDGTFNKTVVVVSLEPVSKVFKHSNGVSTFASPPKRARTPSIQVKSNTTIAKMPLNNSFSGIISKSSRPLPSNDICVEAPTIIMETLNGSLSSAPPQPTAEGANLLSTGLRSDRSTINPSSVTTSPTSLEFSHYATSPISHTSRTDSYTKGSRGSLKNRILSSIRPSLVSVGFCTPRGSVVSEKQKRYAKDERNLTLMLIITVLQHIICTAPQAVITMFDSAELRKTSLLLESTFLITNCLEALNYVLNFYIYSLFVKDFRIQFIKICRDGYRKFKARITREKDGL